MALLGFVALESASGVDKYLSLVVRLDLFAQLFHGFVFYRKARALAQWTSAFLLMRSATGT
jgi:hypothetical protein